MTAGHPAIIICATNSAFTVGTFTAAIVTASGGSYSFGVPAAGTYYIEALLGTSSAPPCETNNSSFPNPLLQGSVYGEPAGSCLSPTAIVVVTHTTGANLSFSDSCGLVTGVSGTVDYTGSLATISSTQPIIVKAYSDSLYTSSVGTHAILSCNSTTYSIVTGATTTEYLRAFVDLNNDGNLDPGDPYINLGSYTPSTSVAVPITFDDMNIYVTPYTLSGTLTYQGAGSHSLYMVLQMGGNPVSVIGPITNGGSYSIPNLTETSSLYAGYDTTGNGLEISATNVQQGNGASLTGSGDIVVLVGYSGSCPNTGGGAHGTAYSSTQTVNIVFGGSTGQSGTSCPQ